ncbi:hypothetical protein F5887DRAFT_932830 [Amanita rubescens]|nr:hypothetical protein F5887DRAFT_932830 [Amanita rubescens]
MLRLMACMYASTTTCCFGIFEVYLSDQSCRTQEKNRSTRLWLSSKEIVHLELNATGRISRAVQQKILEPLPLPTALVYSSPSHPTDLVIAFTVNTHYWYGRKLRKWPFILR